MSAGGGGMHFTLVYDGELKANGDTIHKQGIRRAIHRQLSELWRGTPYRELRKPAESLTASIGAWRFFPLASSKRHELAELRILMLRPRMAVGSILEQGGDIDNRLKTLFDALRMPREAAEIPASDHPGEDEIPFFCLLEDDILITSLSIETDWLLEPSPLAAQVKMVIRVHIARARPIGANMVGRLV